MFFSHEGGTEETGAAGSPPSGKKRNQRNEGEKRGNIPEMTLIDSGPAEINAREVPGHGEGDLILGKGYKSAIRVTVERTTRFVQMDLLESVEMDEMGTFYHDKVHHIWLWWAIDHERGEAIAFWFGRREHKNFDKLMELLEPLKIGKVYTDGTYR
jgi:hypothetical protein